MVCSEVSEVCIDVSVSPAGMGVTTVLDISMSAVSTPPCPRSVPWDPLKPTRTSPPAGMRLPHPRPVSV